MDKAVIFDMDGVIVNSNPLHNEAFEVFLQKHKIELPQADLKEHVYGRTNQEIMPFLFGKSFNNQELEAFANEKEGIYRTIFGEDLYAVDGLFSFLIDLKKNGFKLAVGTSAPKVNLDFVLDNLGIRSFFDVTLDSSDVTHGKPNPEIYLNVAKALDMAPEACVVFEDSVAGVNAGIAAGMKVIGLTTTHSAVELEGTTFCINDFTTISANDVSEVLQPEAVH